MKKTIRLTETDLTKLIKRLIKEEDENLSNIGANSTNITTNKKQSFNITGKKINMTGGGGMHPEILYRFNNYNDKIKEISNDDVVLVEFELPFKVILNKSTGTEDGISNLNVSTTNTSTKISMEITRKRAVVSIRGRVLPKYGDFELNIAFEKYKKPEDVTIKELKLQATKLKLFCDFVKQIPNFFL